ncbi:hypothetical protein JZ751_002728 [Albula glossodonta]|uniref:MAX gene-associated protein n=1 Tax=Albula glossodonta TaxID=121402 RepID=A0A8T2NC66_9TELE|nr:hypothetical protein JZ751_002728 [Albula glossodonta]
MFARGEREREDKPKKAINGSIFIPLLFRLKKENQALMVLHEEGAAAPAPAPASATPPAFFVILKPGQASEGGRDQGILVANQEANLATTSTPDLPGLCPSAPCVPSVTSAAKSNAQPDNLPPESTCKGIKVTLDNNNMWNEFYRCKTEMILTKQGRRMFPYCRFRMSGMEPFQRYILVMDITPVNNHRYRWTGQQWEVNGMAEPHVLGRVFIHPDSPSSGHYWMQNPISFYKLKLTNNTLDQEGHVILHSKHRYLPRLHVVPADKATEVIQLNGPDVMTFTFPQTEFIAVTAYQNLRITQLKIDYNPFAKGFREEGPGHQPLKPRPEPPNSSTETPKLVGDNKDVSPLKKGLKSLLINSTFVMDKELFSSTDRNIGPMDNGKSNVKSPEKDVSNKKRLRNGTPSEAVPETKLRTRRSVSERSLSACSSDKFDSDNMTRKEKEVESVGDRVVSQESQPDGLTGQLKSAGGEPGMAIKPPSDLSPGASSAEPLQGSPASGPAGPTVSAGTAGSKPPVPSVKCDDSDLEQVVRPAKRAEPVPLPLLALFLKQRRLKPRTIAPKPNSAASKSPSSEPTDCPNTIIACLSTIVACLGTIFTCFSSIIPCPHAIVPSSCTIIPCLHFIFTCPGVSIISSPNIFSPSLDGLETSDGLDESDPFVNTEAFAASSASKPPSANQTVPQASCAKRKRKSKSQSRKHGKHGRRSDAEPVVMGGPTDVSMQPNLEDVEGLLFVSFTSKEALVFHLGDQPLNRELPPPPQKAPEPPENEVLETVEEKIARLQNALLQDLKRVKHRQVIHPVLQEDGAIPFISRTGKTTDFTKIKGWRDKFKISSDGSSSKTEGSDGGLKHRSAFCSDMLDEYLANEGKLIDERAESFTHSTVTPVAYQLPTKSTSYVRTLDSVLKKQTSTPALPSAPLKPLSPPKKPKTLQRPKAPAKPKPPKPTLVPAAAPTTQTSPSIVPTASHSAKPAAKTKTTPKALRFVGPAGEVPGPEDPASKVPVRQDSGQATQGPGNVSSRSSGLSKLLLKLMDLEDGAVWEGKSRTCITQERAEIALASLLTAEGSSKAGPVVTKVIKRRAPPCLNAFCRLGCVCASLALERRQPTHCGKTECMFGCTCLKHRVVLVKTPPKKKKEEGLIFYGALGEEEAPPKKKKKKKRMMAYILLFKTAISEPEPSSEPAARVRTLWNQKDENDLEPLHIPEPIHFPFSALPFTCQDYSGFTHRTLRPQVELEDDKKDPVYLYFESKMTCARVRPYKSKPPPPQSVCSCRSLLCSGKEDDPYHNFPDSTPAMGKIPKQSTPSSPKTQPSKRLEIMSECKWEKKSDRNHVLRVVCEHMAQNRLSKPFQVGPYHIRPLSQIIKLEGQGRSITYKVCISKPQSAEVVAAKEKKEQEEEAGGEVSNDDAAERTVVHKRTALPFLTGVSPAGILTASKKQAGMPALGLIKVNGKSYPQAKLQLGQMGALHPANRLAAYITGRLRPISQEVSTVSKRLSTAGLKDAIFTPQRSHPNVTLTTSTATVTSVTTSSAPALNTTVTKPTVGKVFTQFVVNKISSLPQRLPNISGPQLVGSIQKLTLSSTPLVVFGTSSPSQKTGPQHTAGGGAPITMVMSPGEHPQGNGHAPVSAHTSSSKTLSISSCSSSVGTPSPSTIIKVPLAMPAASPITLQSVSPGHQKDGNTPLKTKVSPSLGGAALGPRMILIPFTPPASGVRGPAPRTPGSRTAVPSFTPPTPGQRMVLQPVRSSSGTTLYRHPNGHLIQLVPLNQLRPAQPNQLIRSPTSVVRLPTPVRLASDSNKTTSAAGKAAVSVTASVTQTTLSVSVTPPSTAPKGIASSTPAPCKNPGGSTPIFMTKQGSVSGTTTFTLSSLSPSLKMLPGFLGQTGTYTLRISPSTGSKESKCITVNPSSSPPASPEVQSAPGGFTLLQLPKSPCTAKPAMQGPSVSSSTPLQRDSDEEPSPRVGEAIQASQNPEESLQVTPAGVVCADHSYTSGSSSLDGSQDMETDHSYTAGSILGQDSQTRAEAESITSPSLPVQLTSPGHTKAEVSSLSDCSKIPPNDPSGSAGAAPMSIVGTRRVSNEEINSELLTRAETSNLPLTGHKDMDMTLVGSPCRPSEARQPLEEGEVEAEVEVDMGGDVGSEEVTEDSEEDSEDNSEDEDVNVISESEGSEEGEAVDIETVEELTEKINIARMKAVAMQKKLDKVRSMHKAKRTTEHIARGPEVQQQQEMETQQQEEEKEDGAPAGGRMQHNVMERRRRSELRELFQQLQEVLGLQHLPKVSKVYILQQANNEIQALVDQYDRLEERKKMLNRQRAAYIKKISQTSGKSEVMIIQKLQDICARQKTLEAQKKRKVSKQPPSQPSPQPRVVEGCLPPPRSPGHRPNILTRRRPPAPMPTSTAFPGTVLSLVGGGTLVTGLGTAIPNQQVLTIKGPLQPFTTILRPVKSTEVPAIPGVASVTINVPGISFPLPVKSPVPETPPSGPSHVLASPVTTSPATKTCNFPKILSVKSVTPHKSEKAVGVVSTEDWAPFPPASPHKSGPQPTEDYGRASLEDGEVLGDQLTCNRMEVPAPGSACGPNNGAEDDRLMSLLSEIAFLNQQGNGEESGLPEVSQTHSPPQDGKGWTEEEPTGGLDGDDDRSLSPLFLQLDEDALGTKNSERLSASVGEEQGNSIASEHEEQPKQGTDVAVTNGFGRQSLPPSVKGGALTPPPLLQMKAGSAAVAADSKAKKGKETSEVSWRPMPRLVPLGLKASGLAQDNTVSTKAPPGRANPTARQSSTS